MVKWTSPTSDSFTVTFAVIVSPTLDILVVATRLKIVALTSYIAESKFAVIVITSFSSADFVSNGLSLIIDNEDNVGGVLST